MIGADPLRPSAYNLLQPALATAPRDRKVVNIAHTAPDIIATGNIGWVVQIAGGTGTPVVHTVEPLDWATGRPKPAALGAKPSHATWVMTWARAPGRWWPLPGCARNRAAWQGPRAPR